MWPFTRKKDFPTKEDMHKLMAEIKFLVNELGDYLNDEKRGYFDSYSKPLGVIYHDMGLKIFLDHSK